MFSHKCEHCDEIIYSVYDIATKTVKEDGTTVIKFVCPYCGAETEIIVKEKK